MVVRVTPMSLSDDTCMDLALRLARRGLGSTWPNPAVGALVVAGGAEIMGRGWTMSGGRPHAEKVALDAAGTAAKSATLYVTLEPCCHQGRGSPCTDAIIEAGIARVVCAIGDPDPRMAGKGFAQLKAAGIDVTVGVGEAQARQVALGHMLRITQARPVVRLKLAVGADGLVPKGEGAPVWVTGDAARAAAHLMRARSDAILVGRGTVLTDNPELTCRLPGLSDRSPVRVVLDTNLAMPMTSNLVNTIPVAPLWVLCAPSASKDREAAFTKVGTEVIRVTGSENHVDVNAALYALSGLGITRLLVEGGPTVLRSFLDAGATDEVAVFEGSKPAGAGGLKPFVTCGLDRLANSGDFSPGMERAVGPDRLTVWQRKGQD